MDKIGFYLVFFAVGSALLSLTSYQFRLMMWMDDMGNGAWVVRAVMLAAGVALVLAGAASRQPAAQPAQTSQQF